MKLSNFNSLSHSRKVFHISEKAFFPLLSISKIEKAIGDDGKTIVKNANIGFCEFFWFKCAGARSCDAWVGGGPIK